jgi:HTH-type transcriptional regulator, sugar sensing transcriptional regulator
MSILQTLKKLGLTSNEVEIYTTLLRHGELSAYELSSKAQLHRQVCYDALERLLSKGFVSYIINNNKKYYKPIEPEKIHNYLEEKKEELNDILPELKEIYQEPTGDTKVEVIKGKLVLRIIYADIFKTLQNTKGTMYAMGIDEEKFLEFDRVAIKQYITKMKKAKLHEKLLSKQSAASFFEGSQSDYKLLPDHLFNPNPTHIYGDKVAIILWGTPMHGIIMQNKEVADSYKKYFLILWDIAKKRKTD